MILYDEIASDTTIMIMICSNRFKWKLLLGFIDDVNVRFWLLHSGHSVASTARANSQGSSGLFCKRSISNSWRDVRLLDCDVKLLKPLCWKFKIHGSHHGSYWLMCNNITLGDFDTMG